MLALVRGSLRVIDTAVLTRSAWRRYCWRLFLRPPRSNPCEANVSKNGKTLNGITHGKLPRVTRKQLPVVEPDIERATALTKVAIHRGHPVETGAAEHPVDEAEVVRRGGDPRCRRVLSAGPHVIRDEGKLMVLAASEALEKRHGAIEQLEKLVAGEL